jgi:hypothetical protein
LLSKLTYAPPSVVMIGADYRRIVGCGSMSKCGSLY